MHKLFERGLINVVIQGETYIVKCPWCQTLSHANRLTPFAIRLKCLNCLKWIGEEDIVPFAYFSMLDED